MGKGGEAEKEREEGAAKIEGGRGGFEGKEKIEEVKRDFEWEGMVTEGGGWVTGEMGVEVLLVRCAVAVAPTEHICTGIYPARYICTGQGCSHAGEALVSARFAKTRSK